MSKSKSWIVANVEVILVTIMSWGPDIEVLSPEDFRQEIKDAVAYMAEQYSR